MFTCKSIKADFDVFSPLRQGFKKAFINNNYSWFHNLHVHALSLALYYYLYIAVYLLCHGALKVARDPTPPHSCSCWTLLIGRSSIQSTSPWKDTEHIDLISDSWFDGGLLPWWWDGQWAL